MKIVCTDIDTASLASSIRDAWLTLGKSYLVLGIYGSGSSLKYRILGDDNNTPALQDAELFDIVSNHIPENWVFMIHSAGEWEISPAAFSKDGFWELFFDGDSSVKNEFDQVVNTLIERDGK